MITDCYSRDDAIRKILNGHLVDDPVTAWVISPDQYVGMMMQDNALQFISFHPDRIMGLPFTIEKNAKR